MLRAMTGVSEPFMEALLDGYAGGFDGVATLVDVGGSSGACLEMIMRRVGTITGASTSTCPTSLPQRRPSPVGNLAYPPDPIILSYRIASYLRNRHQWRT